MIVKSERKKYLFSVIVPIYNVERYLDEALQSITDQTIGFEEHIQLILVNDGSTDRSADICRKHYEQYPDNVVYIEKENGGASSARNEGMKYIRGEYVNFFDGDDKWELDAFSLAFDFLEKHREEIDVVSGRICFFEKQTGFTHPLDYKYTRKGIVDIKEKPSFIQMAVSHVFIKADAVADKRFESRLRFGEDSLFIGKVILEKCKYGIIPEAVYYYRKRYNSDSVTASNGKDRSWYFDTPKYGCGALFEHAIEKYGEIIPYCQYHVMYDLQWRLKTPMGDDLTDEEKESYTDLIVSFLKVIDDVVIVKQKYINFAYKIFALRLKHGRNVLDTAWRDGRYFKIDGTKIFDTKSKKRLRIDILELEENILALEGITHLGIIGNAYKLGMLDRKNKFYPFELYSIPHKDITGFTGERIFAGTGFRSRLELHKGGIYEFVLREESTGKYVRLNPSFGKYAKLSSELKSSYYKEGTYIIKLREGKLVTEIASIKKHVKHELRFLKNDVLGKRYYRLAVLRVLAKLIKSVKKKEIWILSDRTHVAGDNAEVLFKYLQKNKNHNAKVYFTLDKKSRDYNRMKRFGKVLTLDSFLYQLKFLCADKIISSHADDWTINAFGENREYMKSIYSFDFIFLQHGIIMHDFSSWLHKHNKNIKLFVTSSQKEYQSIVSGNYGYDERVVRLTGLPRYDRLENERKKKIVFLPTWRKQLAGKADSNSSERFYSEAFKDSEYYKFYNDLINDERILNAMKTEGYSGEFYVHQMLGRQAKDFIGNDVIHVSNESADYNKVFKENALLITDYSSVAFDFIYMKKPVIYAQFDGEIINKTHTYKPGYFDYERDGFGPVCYDRDAVVKAITDHIENDCRMEEIYQKRADEFFSYRDRNNCERVYREILQMK